jgi:hypothetical protein
MDEQPTINNKQQRCIHCPTPENLHCAGLDVRRFCELIDPSCLRYDPGYLAVIVNETRRDATFRNALLRSHQDAIERGGGTIVIPVDCCGGGLAPGIFDVT